MKSIKTNQIYYLMQSIIEPSLLYLGVCSVDRNPVTAFKYVVRDMQKDYEPFKAVDAHDFELVDVNTNKDKIYDYIIESLEKNNITPKFINRQFTTQHEYNLYRDAEEIIRLI